MREEILKFYLLALLLAIPLTNAASVVQMGISDTLMSVIVILGFVGILLYLGGVIKFSGAGSWKNKIPTSFIAFAIFLIIVFVVPMFVKYPSYIRVDPTWQSSPLPPTAGKIFIMLGLPEDWMYVPAIIYLFIIPFAAIYTLVWAFLNDLGVFKNVSNKRINIVLAFLIAFSTIPLGYFTKLVHVLFAFLGGYSVAMFAAMMIVGIFGKGYGYAVNAYAKTAIAKQSAKIKVLHQNVKNLLAEVQKARDDGAARAVLMTPAAQAMLREYGNMTGRPMEIEAILANLNGMSKKDIVDALKKLV